MGKIEGKSKRNKGVSEFRHPTEKKCPNPTDTHTSFSLGTRERALLKYMSETRNSRFNIKGYARLANIPRSTLYDILSKLDGLDLIDKKHTGCYEITSKGLHTLEVSDGGVGSVRRGCRDSINLSQHFTRYILPIKEKSQFFENNLKKLNALEYKELNLPNLKQHYLYFNDATIIINPKKIIIRVHDIVSDDTEKTLYKSMNIALTYIDKLSTIGLTGDSIQLDNAHFARVKSVFSEVLSKYDDRYSLDLGNGVKFWIDNSHGNNEDETNDVNVRDRIDAVLTDAIKSDSLLSDVDKMKEVMGLIVKLKAIDAHTQKQELMDLKIPKGRPSYMG